MKGKSEFPLQSSNGSLNRSALKSIIGGTKPDPKLFSSDINEWFYFLDTEYLNHGISEVGRDSERFMGHCQWHHSLLEWQESLKKGEEMAKISIGGRSAQEGLKRCPGMGMVG